jgi:hypothetical protein
MVDPRRVFHLHFGVAALGVGITALAALVSLSRLCLKAPVDEVVARCDDLLATADVAGALILLLSGLAATVIGRIVWTASSIVVRARRAIRRLPVSGVIDGAFVLETSQLEAFCAGFWRPRAYVSRGALEALSPEELSAVIAHEQHHAARRDPLRSLAARSVTAGLFFLPSLRDSAERLRSATEIAADEAAISTTGDVRHLASALLTFDSRHGGVSPERVDHLLGETAQRRLPLLRIAGGVLAIGALIAVTATLAVAISPDSIVVSLVAGHALVLATGGALLAGLSGLAGRRLRQSATGV